MNNAPPPPHLTKIPHFRPFSRICFEIFDRMSQRQGKFFCKMRVHSGFLRFANSLENGLKGGEFVKEGGGIIYLTPCTHWPMGS